MKCPHCNSEFYSLTGPAPRCPQCDEALQVSDDLLLPPDARDAAGRGEEATVDFPPLGSRGACLRSIGAVVRFPPRARQWSIRPANRDTESHAQVHDLLLN